MLSQQLKGAVEFIHERVYYVALRSVPRDTDSIHFFSIDKELIFWNFYLDFGPLSIAQIFRFSEMLHRRIEDPRLAHKKIYYYSNDHGEYRANAVCLLACWGVIYQKMTPHCAFAPFASLAPFPPFHDATQGICTFKLTIMDCLSGLFTALGANYINVRTFDVDAYEHFEKVENGDLSWLSPKFCAFAGPKDPDHHSAEAYTTLSPQHYIPTFLKNNVTLVIRLNKSCYDEQAFREVGIDHLSLYYPDGGNPPLDMLEKFITACEATSGAVAVHCKAGLGRTGTCIGCYMMKHDRFSAHDVIGWLRLCRPGSVIGPQQGFMTEMQPLMWQAQAGGNVHVTGTTTSVSLPMTNYKAVRPMSKLGPLRPKESVVIYSEDTKKSQGDFLVNAKRNQQHASPALTGGKKTIYM